MRRSPIKLDKSIWIEVITLISDTNMFEVITLISDTKLNKGQGITPITSFLVVVSK